VLPEILACKQAHQRSWRILEAKHCVLLLDESAFPLPAAQCLDGLGKTRANLHASTPCYKVEVIRRARLRSVRSGYGTTQNDARLEVDARAQSGPQWNANGPLGDDAQIAKSGELPLKALVRVDAIRKACLTNLDGALDCLFTEVEHPVYERPKHYSISKGLLMGFLEG